MELRELYLATIEALDPGAFVSRYLATSALRNQEALTLLAIGKAAVPMASAALVALDGKIAEQVVVAPQIPAHALGGWMSSSHPRPGPESLVAARRLLEACARARGPILVLISGGGSSLVALPCAGVTLEQKIALVDQVYAAGTNIDELNVVRKHLSAIKGGRLAAAAATPITTLLLSDVVGNSLSTIASGPTVPDSSTFADAVEIAGASLKSPQGAAFEYLLQGAAGLHEETPTQPRSGDTQVLLAGVEALVTAASDLAREQGIVTKQFPTAFAGSVEDVATEIMGSLAVPAAGEELLVGGGEATIALPPEPGIGGRAQQLALHLAREIAGRPVEILVAGSDGVDGSSDAAGALVDGGTWGRLCAQSDPEGALRRCDAASALAVIGAQIHTGPTGINHADLVLVRRGHAGLGTG